jgi:ABC-type multidrug transport system fused ATPase/permease subunit
MKTIRRLLGFLTFREKFLVSLSILIRLGLVALDLAGIFLVGVVVSLISGTTIANTSPLAIGLAWLRANGFENGYAVILGFAVGFFILKGILSFILTFLTANYVGRIEASKARLAFEGMFNSSAAEVAKFARQDILHGLTNSMNSAFGTTITIGSGITGEIGLLVGVSAYLAFVNLTLFTYVALFFGAVGFLMQATIGTLSGVYAKRQHESFIRSQGTVLDAVANYKQLAIGDSKAFVERFSGDRVKTARSSAIYATLGSLPRYITEISVMVGVGLLVLQRSTAASSISAATIAVFLAGIFRIVASMLPLQSGLSYFKRIQHDAELGFRMIEEFGSKASPEIHTTISTGFAPDVVVSNLEFRYPSNGDKVLADVSFKIPKGSYCAIVGKSGAGKSTLIDLVLGLYVPNVGSVKIDGLAPNGYRRVHPGSIGYVPQSTTLIAGSLLENITMQPGVKTFDQKRLDSALHMANIENLVTELPEGLESQLGTGGVSLSGGQEQRVGLARALYNNPKMLVLDEATSALDDESESAIRFALDRLRGEVTILVIAHRPSTLQSADLVLSVKAKTVKSFESYEAYKAN